MQINFTGNHIDVTSALREHAIQKFDKLLRHCDNIHQIDVVFDVIKLRHIAEATVRLKKAEFHASAESSDMYFSVEELIKKLDRQLIKHKSKQQH